VNLIERRVVRLSAGEDVREVIETLRETLGVRVSLGVKVVLLRFGRGRGE
jgi:predicted DNA-binding protein with PD1-like motif